MIQRLLEEAKFSCAEMELDMEKSLRVQLEIDGEIQRIEYKRLLIICFSYGRIGHSSIYCLENKESKKQKEIVNRNDKASGSAIIESGMRYEKVNLLAMEKMAEFGLWLRAQSRARRNNTKKESGALGAKNHKKDINCQSGSRFEALAEWQDSIKQNKGYKRPDN